MLQRWGSLVLCVVVAFAWALSAQDAPRQLTARELFYTAADAPAAAARPVVRAPATALRKRPKAAPAPAAASTKLPETAPSQPAATLPDGGRVVDAVLVTNRATAPAPTGGKPALGLKYSIRRCREDADIAPDTVFHAGDRIQFRVETNGPGYLYIINQGSSGAWKAMFPSAEVENGDNHVDGWSGHAMPPGACIGFDEQTGVEKVFIVLSRQPEPDLESMIYSLQAKPASAPAERPAPKQLLMASSMNIEDSTVGRLRTTYARDLVIEKVDPSTAGERKEYAVYVVNPTGSADSRVVADLQLVHK